MILVVIFLYYSFLVSSFPILRMVITLYIYSVHEQRKDEWKTIIHQFQHFLPSQFQQIKTTQTKNLIPRLHNSTNKQNKKTTIKTERSMLNDDWQNTLESKESMFLTRARDSNLLPFIYIYIYIYIYI